MFSRFINYFIDTLFMLIIHIIYTMGRKRANSDILDGTKKKKKEPLQDGLTAQASAESPSQRCWKCRGRGKKYQKSTQAHDGTACKVCEGEGIRKKSQRSQDLASKPGQILKLRGYPEDHPLRQIFTSGFSGPSSWWGRLLRRRRRKCSQDDEESFDYLQTNLRPYNGELVGSLGCGDWRIYQIADGNKLTVDDFVCAWVAAEEMRKRGYGSHLHRDNAMIGVDGKRMFGGGDNEEKPRISDDGTANNRLFNHADIGTGCGSVLMMTAWAFLGEINSVGIEAQKVSFDCLRRGLEWNIGSDGSHSNDVIQIRQEDLRTWDGCGVAPEGPSAAVEGILPSSLSSSLSSTTLRPPYRLITGTPPYFPLDSFVASQNHNQKVCCRVPTRGCASDYIKAASRLLLEEGDYTASTDIDGGVFCMVEAAFNKAEADVLDTVEKCNMRVRRRVDVVTRFGLEPRFSCWVMTKKKKKSDSKNNKNKSDSGKATTANKSSSTTSSGNSNDNKLKKCSGDIKYDFPIETFTLRNADLTRTEEYSNAMEIMGWVDFEKYKKQSGEEADETTNSTS